MCKRIEFGQVSTLMLLSVTFSGGIPQHCEAAAPDPVVVETNSACTAGGIPFACCVLTGIDNDQLNPNCDKVRFLSFTPPTNSTGATALRIQLVSLHHVSPPYGTGLTIPFTLFEGQSVYVGPPDTYVESSASGTPFKSSRTQCTPYYQDWNTVGLLHVHGSAIVPSSQYSVEHLASDCNGVEGSAACLTGGANVSVGQAARTARWGDVETPYNPPSATTQPNFGDISAVVNKFKDVPNAPIKVRVLNTPSNAFGEITTNQLSLNVGFAAIASCIDAFRGPAYPAKMGKCANSTAACSTHAECGANGPCNLYCPD